jgi:AraC-like DNA-binding protein
MRSGLIVMGRAEPVETHAGVEAATPWVSIPLAAMVRASRGATFGPAPQELYEFVWMLEGHGEWRSDGVSCSLAPGSVLLLQPGMNGGFLWDRSQHSVHGFCHFHILAPPPGLPPPTSWPLIQRLAPATLSFFTHLAWLHTERPAGWVAMEEQWLQQILVSYVCAAFPTAAPPVAMDSALSRAVSRIADEWRRLPLRHIAVEELASAAIVSRIHLYRLFMAHFELGPADLLRLTRLERCAGMLRTSTMSIQAVSEAGGFASAFHFSAAFKAAFGKSPSAFRRDHIDGEDHQHVPQYHAVQRLAGQIWPDEWWL